LSGLCLRRLLRAMRCIGLSGLRCFWRSSASWGCVFRA
jgi:hypothetical protein